MAKHLMVLAILLAAVNTSGQTMIAIGNVPFDFIANDIAFVAGHYDVLTPSTLARSLILRNTETGKSVMVSYQSVLRPNSQHTQSGLIFTRSNGRVVLHQVRREGDDYTYDLLHAPGVPEPDVAE